MNQEITTAVKTWEVLVSLDRVSKCVGKFLNRSNAMHCKRVHEDGAIFDRLLGPPKGPGVYEVEIREEKVYLRADQLNRARKLGFRLVHV